MVTASLSGSDLAATARWLRSDHPAIAKELRKAVRESAKPILEAERAAVRSLTFTTVVTSRSRVLRRKQSRVIVGPGKGGGSGAKQRAAARGTTNYATATSTGRRLLTAKQAARVRAGAGLRDTIARGMRVTYADRGREVKATVKTTSTQLPESQKRLPRLINYGRWRHPVFAKGGDRKQWTWVDQYTDRRGWWWATAEKELPAAMVAVGKSLDAIADQIAAEGVKRSDRPTVG